MPLGIFRKPYVVRRREPQKVINGYATSAFSDIYVRLNVQPKVPNKFEGREEGDLTVNRLRAWGADKLTSADELTGTPGDLLFYKGRWYECISCVEWHNTLLAHYQSDFVIMPVDSQLDPPSTAPEPKYMIPMPPEPPGKKP